MLTGFKDSTGSEFRVGDLVVNTMIMDLWMVGKYSDSPKFTDYEEKCPFFLCLYSDTDTLYIIDLNKTRGFLRGECQGCDLCEEYKTKISQKMQQDIPIQKL